MPPEAPPPPSARPALRPLMIYDGDCSFCRRWIERWRRLTGDAVAYEPYQTAAARFPQVPVRDFERAVHLVERDGTITRGADAVFRSLAAGGRDELLWMYRRVPGVRWASELAYRFVARHRGTLDRIERTLSGTRHR